MYYYKIKKFKKEILRICNEIFKVYGYELQLRLEEYNLLSNTNNCIQSSTAIGYILEEFLVSKLEIYTTKDNEYTIQRSKNTTNNASYDCFATVNDILYMINIKAVQNSNNSIAAINILYNDYVLTNPNKLKCFLLLKVFYSFKISSRDQQRKIFIEKIDSFFLEEIDFNNEHKQDHRNWSKNFNPNSGRLQVSDSFRKNNKVPVENISYQNTVQMLNYIIERNKH